MGKEKTNNSQWKMEGDELQDFLHFRKRGFILPNKKGKGSYNRKEKHKQDYSKE